MSLNFADALNTKVGDIERPPILPVGTYLCTVSKIPSMDTVGQGLWDTVDFNFNIIAPQDDVDQEALDEFAAKAGTVTSHRGLRQRFMFNKSDEGEFARSLFNLRRFLSDSLLIDKVDKIPLKQALDNSVNAQCYVTVKWRQDKNDADVQYAEVGRTAAVD